MVNLHCLFAGHEIGSPVTRNGRAYWKCMRCQGLSRQPIDVPVLPDPPTPAIGRRRRIWWLRAVISKDAS